MVDLPSRVLYSGEEFGFRVVMYYPLRSDWIVPGVQDLYNAAQSNVTSIALVSQWLLAEEWSYSMAGTNTMNLNLRGHIIRIVPRIYPDACKPSIFKSSILNMSLPSPVYVVRTTSSIALATYRTFFEFTITPH